VRLEALIALASCGWAHGNVVVRPGLLFAAGGYGRGDDRHACLGSHRRPWQGAPAPLRRLLGLVIRRVDRALQRDFSSGMFL